MKNEGIENLRLAYKLFLVRKAMIDLNCQVVFRPRDVEFEKIQTGKVIGEGNSLITSPTLSSIRTHDARYDAL